MVKPIIACYITGGWTECGYMTAFLRKVNDRYDYRQRFPQKNIGKKGKSRAKIVGTTGKDLVRKMYADLGNHKAELSKVAAILIEDDMDDQYFLVSGYGRNYAMINRRTAAITRTIRQVLGKPELPVFFLYALPEIEAWFVADWEHAFGEEYKVHLGEMNGYFSTTFKKYVAEQVLTSTYPISQIENYGMFGGKYRKLSDELIQAIQGYSSQTFSWKNNQNYNAEITQLIRDNKICYSKKEQGVNMLNRLEPEKVARNCQHYFSRTYAALKVF